MSRRNSIAITPDNDNNLSKPITALFVGGAGNLKIECVKDTVAVTLTAVPAGTLLENIQIKKIHATGTTATLLIGFY